MEAWVYLNNVGCNLGKLPLLLQKHHKCRVGLKSLKENTLSIPLETQQAALFNLVFCSIPSTDIMIIDCQCFVKFEMNF